MRHEKLPKDKAPKKGGTYIVKYDGNPVYSAEIVEYGGGCWATLKVVKGENEKLHKSGMTFDVKVAMYEFEPVE